MGLLTKEKEIINDDYFKVWDIVKILRQNGNNSWEEIGEFLGHYNFDTELILSKKDEYHRIYEVRNNYSVIRNLILSLSIAWLEGEETIKKLELDVLDYYWYKHEILNFAPIVELGIISKPSTGVIDAFSCENNNSKNDYRVFLFKKPLLCISEASCIISGDDPNTVSRCENDTNFDQNFNEYSHAFNLINSAIMANLLPKDELQFYGIKKNDFKNYLISESISINGYTDNQQESNAGIPTIGHAPIEHYKKQCNELRAENEKLKEEIQRLKSEKENQAKIQTSDEEAKLHPREENNIIRVLAVLADMEKKIDLLKPYEAHGIMLVRAQTLGIEPFPSDESIKKWFSKAHEFKNPN